MLFTQPLVHLRPSIPFLLGLLAEASLSLVFFLALFPLLHPNLLKSISLPHYQEE